MAIPAKSNKLPLNPDDARTQVIIEIGPSSEPYSKIIIKEKRNRPTDRRQINTFLAAERRCGIADRRKPR